MSIIDKFREMSENRHQYAKDWKERTGGKVMGTLCTYVPLEIVYAAGMLPVRILGTHEVQDVTDRYLFPTVCPFCRDALAQGLKGRYDYLDGLSMGRTCSHIQGTFDNWRNYIPTPLIYYIWFPCHRESPRSVDCLVGEYKGFKEALEKLFSVKVDKVHIICRPGKSRMVNRRMVTGPAMKKAIITLAKGYSLDLFDQAGKNIVKAEQEKVRSE